MHHISVCSDKCVTAKYKNRMNAQGQPRCFYLDEQHGANTQQGGKSPVVDVLNSTLTNTFKHSTRSVSHAPSSKHDMRLVVAAERVVLYVL